MLVRFIFRVLTVFEMSDSQTYESYELVLFNESVSNVQYYLWFGQITDSITELKVIFGHIWFDIYVLQV